MTSRQLILLIVALVLLGAIVVFGTSLNPRPAASPSPTPGEVTACTMDAKICPDGSAVGRIPPTCEFAQCPVGNVSPATSTQTFMARFGQKVGDSAVTITPLELVEDSRCPIDVVCIQAGTVRVLVDLTANSIYSQHILTLEKPLNVGDRTVTLTRVVPSTQAGVQIPSATYNFTFTVVKR